MFPLPSHNFSSPPSSVLNLSQKIVGKRVKGAEAHMLSGRMSIGSLESRVESDTRVEIKFNNSETPKCLISRRLALCENCSNYEVGEFAID